MAAHRLLIPATLAVALLAADGRAVAAAESRPAYCAKLLLISQDWRTICTKQSPVRCDGHSLDDRRDEVVRRLIAVAKAASASGRADVGKAVTLSAAWVASHATATGAIRARATHLGERMTAAGWKANRTIKADCGFAPYSGTPQP